MNYNKWDKFDPDLVCKEIDVQQSIESSKQAKKKAFVAAASENEVALTNAKKAAEALQSQADVAALKAKGIGGRRRREKAEQDVNVPAAPTARDDLGPKPTSKMSITEKLNVVTDFLYRLLKQVEEIRACTEKKSRHEEGYHLAMRCLADTRTFSRIKNATVVATLRSSAAEGELPEAGNTRMKVLQDLEDSEAFLINQTVNCLSLFALSIGELALAADTSRYVLKRQGSAADAGVWIMRGLAFAAIGAPYIARMHFNTAHSVNAEYPGLSACVPVVEAASMAYGRRTGAASRPELVSRELARAVQRYFASRARVLQEVADLAVITAGELKNFLDEGSLWEYDPAVVFQLALGSEVASTDTIASAHLNDECNEGGQVQVQGKGNSVSIGDEGWGVPASAVVAAVQRLVEKHRSDCALPTASSPFARLGKSGAAAESLVASVLVHMCRKLFYEAQMLYLESFYHGAECKYAACVVLAQALRSLVPDPQDDRAVFATRMESVCGLNSAMCLIHRTPAGRRTRTVGAVQDGVADLCDQALVLCDTLPGRLRRIAALEHMHRFAEALTECEAIEQILQTTLPDRPQGCLVAPAAGSLSQSLSQQFLCGAPLSMPVPSLLSEDVVVQQADNKRFAGESETTMETMNLDFLLTDNPANILTLNAEQTVRSDQEVSREACRRHVEKRKQRLQFLVRKYGA